MFTGLIETVGRIEQVRPRNSGTEFHVSAPAFEGDFTLGESIACDGCCLTVEAFTGATFTLFASPETLRKTTFGHRKSGDLVNLERAMKLGDRLGGHLVSGHVDAQGTFVSARDLSESWEVKIKAPEVIMQQCIEKGSVAVDGISLTLVDVTAEGFSLWIIPETWKKTTLSARKPGDAVNLEADQIGKFVRKSLEPWLEKLKGNKLEEILRNFRG
ncbi:MAG: riboflavin synthase [Sumerlaeia bacterium]